MPSTRDPFPFPKYENDDSFMGRAKREKVSEFSKPTHLAQQEDPWNRLNTTATLSSSRREVYHFDPEAPRDNLDFVLKTTYNHHEELLRDKNQTVIQKETVTEDHGRILKNRVKEVPSPTEAEKYATRLWVSPAKQSIHNIGGAIESHHSASTNRGYSRKHDGGFYCT
ncbi:cilia- and flagella-associated protein 276 [Erpetoichthys calabaricus]|uniref:Si:ch211-163l21.7 n=1 Tax=Erpetoichthys calabaricus TaxID=27687 RepID=A0A8C4SSK0_ERPCA|nr:cilia- and flagella-associated protein 276 [Erpetoichthys calabaricus]